MYTAAMSEPERPAFQVAAEILDQPRAWATALELAASEPGPLPAGERVAVIGCGTSWHAAKAIAALREAAGQGETDAFAASEAELARPYDRVLAISRSGTTTEVRQALEAIAPGVPRAALVGDPASPVAEAADVVVDLSFADDLSVVQSRFVTTVVLLARAWFGEDVSGLPAQAEAALAAPQALDPAALDRAVLLGRGWRVGVADAGALALRETAQMWAESYPAMEFRHGPIANAGPGAAVWFFDEPPAGLVEEVAATGATPVRAELDPLAELVRVQRLAVAIAELRGLDPDRPPHLSRAVVLERPGKGPG
jgi:fructoselysine-6-P-deglycase FrlB-like protein